MHYLVKTVLLQADNLKIDSHWKALTLASPNRKRYVGDSKHTRLSVVNSEKHLQNATFSEYHFQNLWYDSTRKSTQIYQQQNGRIRSNPVVSYQGSVKSLLGVRECIGI